ncbi:HNH endonuclease signature motif containing protein [Raineyella sp.]|uniref:HNH nuclease domain-containing protein n=1 Tax=bioreactor metagenome TaxID=1076179 RepID=A0A644Z974_9ZZZZ|nr:DUF222 domain-containing protein [Raineyella sp.]MEA5154977.1 DUF222 domain-containing protein [Raineyella sp.]
MEREWGTRTGAVLAGVLELLDGLEDDRALATDTERVALADVAIKAADRLQMLAGLLVAEAEAHRSDTTTTGLGIVSWLADTRRMTRREVRTLLHQGRDLAQFPVLATAGLAGRLSPQQARAISHVLTELPDDLDPALLTRAQHDMVHHAAHLDSHGLAVVAEHLLEVLAPDTADELEAERLERERRLAARNRHLSLTPDGHGSVQVRGKLPALAAQTLIVQLDALADRDRRRALDALDPLAEDITPAMRRADALIALAEAAALHRDAPTHGGDRPRIVVTISEERLRDLATGATLIGPGDAISASDLRRLCCDADLVPAVLGTAGEVLDVGREHRLVTPPIRTALTVRDRGCVFPGCDRPPAACHAHHIIPWQRGGATALDNLALVCPHHHGIVEPGSDPPGRRWEIRLGADGLPEILPPHHVDSTRRPRRHQRFHRPTAA